MKIIAAVSFLLAGFVAWLMWGPILYWMWAQLPQTSEWHGVLKILCVIVIGWCGGIAFPLAILSFGIMAISKE